MSLSLIFWVLMLIWLVFGLWSNWPATGGFRPIGNTLLIFILLCLLGYKVMGPPIHS